MDTRNRHSSDRLENPEVLHEESDVNVRGIVSFGLGLALCIALSSVVLYFMFDLLRSGFTPTPVHSSPLIGVREPVEPENAPKLFPGPRLQVDYAADLDAVRQRWDEQLTTYGWQDKKAGVVHIPIEDAMRLTLQRGLPARSAAGQPAGGVQPSGKRTRLVASSKNELRKSDGSFEDPAPKGGIR